MNADPLKLPRCILKHTANLISTSKFLMIIMDYDSVQEKNDQN